MASDWILPVIQGFVQIERCFINHLEDLNVATKMDETDGCSDDEDSWDLVDYNSVKYKSGENLKEDEFDLVVISRRSRHRAGNILNFCIFTVKP